MRGAEVSRTHKLCRAFLDGREFTQVDLTKEIPSCLSGEEILRRDELIDSGKKDFKLATQFAKAEEILVGAPYWDLSFPAALKAYIEQVSIREITFKNTATGVAGLCNAKKLIYITTVGGYINEQGDFGTDYMRGLCKFFGIPKFETFRAEGLDIETNNAEDIIREAMKRLEMGRNNEK